MCVCADRAVGGTHFTMLPEGLSILAAPRQRNHGGIQVQEKVPGANSDDNECIDVLYVYMSL